MLIILWGTEMLFTHKIGFGSNQYDKENLFLGFEAAVLGAVPVVKSISDTILPH